MKTTTLTAKENKALKIKQASEYITRQLKDKASQYAAYSYAEALYDLTEAEIETIRIQRGD